MKLLIRDQKGQTFIIVFLLMLIALTIGISVSTRFTRSLRRVVQTDEVTRANFLAESALEKFLELPITTLEDYIIYDNCGSECVFQLTDNLGRALVSEVTLSFIGESTDYYELDLFQNRTEQIYLGEYPLNTELYVCWEDDASVYASYVYEDSGSIKQDTYAYNSIGYMGVQNNFDTATPLFSYNNCFTVVTNGDTVYYLRLKSYYEDTTVFIVPAIGQSVPRQGILIESLAKVGETTKKVSAIRRNSMLPGMFDYVLYQKSQTDTLSN